MEDQRSVVAFILYRKLIGMMWKNPKRVSQQLKLIIPENSVFYSKLNAVSTGWCYTSVRKLNSLLLK